MDYGIYDLSCAFFDGCYSQALQKGKYLPARVTACFEIELFTQSAGGVITNGDYIHFDAGDIAVRAPGQHVQGVLPYSCYVIKFSVLPNDFFSAFPPKIPSSDAEDIKEAFMNIYKNCMLPDIPSRLEAQANLYHLLSMLCRNLMNSENETYNPHIRSSVRYIQNHLCDDISVSQLLEVTSLSKSQFHKLFKAYTGTTPTAFITSCRIEKAKNLLKITDWKISDIAGQCGFSDQAYFTFLFRKATGMSPLKFRSESTV